MKYKLNLSNKASAHYMKVYDFARKFKIKSSMLDNVVSRKGLVYTTSNSPELFKDYEFNDRDITVAKLYEYKDAGQLVKGLKKIAKKHHDVSFLPTQLDTANLDKIYKKDISVAADWNYINVGALRFKDDNETFFSLATFHIETLSNNFLLLHVIFSLNAATKTELEKARKLTTTRQTIGIDITWSKKVKSLHHSVSSSTGWGDYFDLLNKVAADANDFLEKRLIKPIKTVNGTVTFYKTKKTSKQTSKDFQQMNIGFFDMNNGYEKLYMGYFGDYDYIRLFLKDDPKVKDPNTKLLPSVFVEDYSPFFFYRAFELFVKQIKDDAYLIISDLSKKRNLKQLFQKNALLSLKKYHLTNIQNMLTGYVWPRYIEMNKYKGGSITRINDFMNSPYDHDKDMRSWLKTSIDGANKQIENAASMLKSELEIKNTKSSNRLSHIILIVAAIALVVASATLYISLYPKTTRDWLCSEHIYCTKIDN